MYWYGYGFIKNRDMADRWLKLSAHQNNVLAQCNLASFCEQDKNYDEIIKWYELSADREYIPACYWIGRIYSGKLDIKVQVKDYIKAVKYFKIAADKGDEHSKKCLVDVLNLIKHDTELMYKLCSKYIQYNKLEEENEGLRTLVDGCKCQDIITI